MPSTKVVNDIDVNMASKAVPNRPPFVGGFPCAVQDFEGIAITVYSEFWSCKYVPQQLRSVFKRNEHVDERVAGREQSPNAISIGPVLSLR